MFIGREHELNKLQQLYGEDKFQMVVLYGRQSDREDDADLQVY